MSAETLAMMAQEERRFERIPFEGRVDYRYGLDDGGTATWRSVGKEGACIALGRYLRPGRHVSLVSDAASVNGDPVELSGRVVWCRPTTEGRTFVAGLRIFSDEPGTASALSGIVRLAQAGVC